jgi:hypothetical protein
LKSFLRTRPPSFAAVVLELLLKLTVYDIAVYMTVQRAHPSLDTPAGDTFLDPHLPTRRASADSTFSGTPSSHLARAPAVCLLWRLGAPLRAFGVSHFVGLW